MNLEMGPPHVESVGTLIWRLLVSRTGRNKFMCFRNHPVHDISLNQMAALRQLAYLHFTGQDTKAQRGYITHKWQLIGVKPRFIFLNLVNFPTRKATGKFPTVSHYIALTICVSTLTNIVNFYLFLVLTFTPFFFINSVISSTIYFYSILIIHF